MRRVAHPSARSRRSEDAPDGSAWARNETTTGTLALGSRSTDTGRMTDVRQSRKSTEPKPPRRHGTSRQGSSASASLGPSKLAQVRLRADEMVTLREAMRVLDLASTSDALREGLRLLTKEASEVAAANEIQAFYGNKPAPLPDGVIAPTERELAAADEIEW